MEREGKKKENTGRSKGSSSWSCSCVRACVCGVEGKKGAEATAQKREIFIPGQSEQCFLSFFLLRGAYYSGLDITTVVRNCCCVVGCWLSLFVPWMLDMMVGVMMLVCV